VRGGDGFWWGGRTASAGAGAVAWATWWVRAGICLGAGWRCGVNAGLGGLIEVGACRGTGGFEPAGDVDAGVGFAAVVAGTAGVGGFGVPLEDLELVGGALDDEPVDGVRGFDSADLALELGYCRHVVLPLVPEPVGVVATGWIKDRIAERQRARMRPWSGWGATSVRELRAISPSDRKSDQVDAEKLRVMPGDGWGTGTRRTPVEQQAFPGTGSLEGVAAGLPGDARGRGVVGMLGEKPIVSEARHGAPGSRRSSKGAHDGETRRPPGLRSQVPEAKGRMVRA
jgi:hypothetical protein